MTDVQTLDEHPLAQHGPTEGTQASPAAGAARRLLIRSGPGRSTDWRQSAGFGAIGLGAVGIVIAWFQIAGEREIWKQLPYLASGGIGGAAAIAIGIALLIAYEHSADRAALDVVLDRLDDLDDRLDGRSQPADEDMEHRIAELEAALRELRRPARAPRTGAGRGAGTRNGQ